MDFMSEYIIERIYAEEFAGLHNTIRPMTENPLMTNEEREDFIITVKQAIREKKLYIEILTEKYESQKYPYENELNLIREAYEFCLSLVKIHHVCYYIVYDYVYFLSNFQEYDYVIKIMEWLLTEFERSEEDKEMCNHIKNVIRLAKKEIQKQMQKEESSDICEKG